MEQPSAALPSVNPASAQDKAASIQEKSAKHLPLTSIETLLQWRPASDSPHLIRVRGTVTLFKAGEYAVIEDNSKSFTVPAMVDSDLQVGDVVDVTGYPVPGQFAPSLRQASFVKTGVKQPVMPQTVSFAEASSGRLSDDLVLLSGELVAQWHDPEMETFVLNVDGHPVRATLESATEFQDYPAGSRLQIIGICKTIPPGVHNGAQLSHLEMRSPADLRFLVKPSWLASPDEIELLAAVSGVGLAIGLWIAFQRQAGVHRRAWKSWTGRAALIAQERSRILQLISSNRALDELLNEIRVSSALLLPGTQCWFDIQLQDLCSLANTAGEVQASESEAIFEVALHDDSNHEIGKMVLSAPHAAAKPRDCEQVYAVLSELAALAMRQAHLYRGLVYHSTHDLLTALPNRRLCESRLASALQEAEENGSQFAVIYIDINRFKFVNDKYGHKIGDLYLVQISARLRNQLRAGDLLARIGGDEFMVIAPFPENFDRVYALTSRLLGCFSDPFTLDGNIVEGSASFGFARYPEHGLTAEELTRHADHEMYASKHEAHMSEEQHGLAIITSEELELALFNGDYRLAYQPQFSSSGKLTGMEALLRLDDPVLGLITPDAFISVAERHPVIVDIGAWVLKTALADASRWGLGSCDPVSLSVNVSVRQLESPNYAKSVLECLKQYNFPPQNLEMELIERSLISGGDQVIEQLVRLRQAGVRISLDDFGTEQSCLSVLHKLPIDTIKLDRSFIRAMDDEANVHPIVQAIVSMAHSLGKRVVAEAIEHVGPVRALMAMGKMDFQGYLLSRPVPPEEVALLMPVWRKGIAMPDAFSETPSARIQP